MLYVFIMSLILNWVIGSRFEALSTFGFYTLTALEKWLEIKSEQLGLGCNSSTKTAPHFQHGRKEKSANLHRAGSVTDQTAGW